MKSYFCEDLQNDICIEWRTEFLDTSSIDVDDTIILSQDLVPFFLLGAVFLFFFVFNIIYEKIRI